MGDIEWRPIESAPMDGSDFLAYGCSEEAGERWEVVFFDPHEPDGSGIYSAGRRDFFGREQWCWSIKDGATLHRDCFTHWRPLPPPPEPK